MKTTNGAIWKFELCSGSPLGQTAEIEMPEKAEILHINDQYDSICLWALVKTTNPFELLKHINTETRTFKILPTGDIDVTEVSTWKYIGTVHLISGVLVYHVFEVIKP